MKLTDLKPEWICNERGNIIGFTFLSPVDRTKRQSCFERPPKIDEQVAIFEQYHEGQVVQPCNPEGRWVISGGSRNNCRSGAGLKQASFTSLTVTPSLDGSAGGLWHGHITNGEIVGGI